MQETIQLSKKDAVLISTWLRQLKQRWQKEGFRTKTYTLDEYISRLHKFGKD